MKIYMCSNCGKTVPLNDLAEHRKTCGPDAELSIKADMRMKARRVWTMIGSIIGLVALSAAAVFMGKGSFKSIAKMRTLERVPATEIQAVLPGEINLTGNAERLSSTITAPKSGTACFYYRYVVEKRTTDSDGDTKWKTITDEEKHTDFRLRDDSGTIPVRPMSAVSFKANKSFGPEQQGDKRYTEYRIDPNDQVFVFGMVVSEKGKNEVRFDRPGHYTPIISERGEARERVGMAGLSVGLCWGGLVCLAFATGLLAWLLRLHRILVYFLVLSIIVAVYLCVLGLQMMKADLRSGAERLEAHELSARTAILKGLGRSVKWNGEWKDLGDFDSMRSLKPATVKRLNRVRLDLAVAISRFQVQRTAFPENVLAPGWGIANPTDLPLPDSQQQNFEELAAKFRKAAVPPIAGWIIVGIAAAAGLGLTIGGFKKVRAKRCIENLPTSKTAGAAYGLCELKGVVELPDGEEPLSGPLTSLPCVEYHYLVKERRRSGKKTNWVTVIDERRARPFLCTDSEGSMKIDPAGANVYSEHTTSKSFGRRRYTETRLELADPLYAIGECVIDENKGDALQLNKPQGDYPFILSNMIESRVMHKVATLGVALLNSAFSAFLLMALVMFGLSGSFAATDYLASALVTPVFMIVVMLVLHYNDLVFLRERADRNWSNIDVSLKKRHDLIPNLEQIVKNYMAHEADLQQSITELRGSYDKSGSRDHDDVGKFIEAEHKTASRVLAVYENYPELKANQTVSLLMRKMIGMENEVAFMRTGYNQAVETYNTRTSTIPDVIFARMFGFKEKKFINAESEVIRMPVSVQDVWQQGGSEGDSSAPPTEPPAPGAPTPPTPPPAAPEGPGEQQVQDAQDGRAVIYALLLDTVEEVKNAQLGAIAEAEGDPLREKTVGLIDAVAKQITDPVDRLRTAEEWLPKLLVIKPSEYQTFVTIVRRLMEQDEDISLFEYALSKSIDRRVDPQFSTADPAPVRHQDMAMITDQVSIVLSRLAQAEEAPGDTAQAAFDEGVSALAHEPKSEFTLKPTDACDLAAFDMALDELALASKSVKQSILEACTKLVVMGGDYTWDQALLTAAIADAFGLNRPDWM